MRKLLFLVLSCYLALPIMGQDQVTVQGVVADASDGTSIPGVAVIMVNVKDSTRTHYGVTNEQGAFTINNLEKAFYRLNVSSLGYKPFTKLIRTSVGNVNLGTITIEQDTKVLENINVIGEVIAVEQKGDTILYNADAFKVNPDATTADLVSKMPGIVVDNSGVSANGEKVQQVLLDGKRFFGQDPLLSLNTIPAEVVKKVEVFDQMSERAQLTGFNDGNTTKTMNVVTKEDKRQGLFGKMYGGYGTDDRYTAGATLNNFKNDTRLTFLGMSNNINQQNFSNEDLAGISGGGTRGGFRPGGPGGNSSMTGPQSGITNTNAIGLNFSDKLGKTGTFEGSYFLNDTHTSNDQTSNRESFRETGSQFYDENKTSTADNLNHRLNMRITYNINDNNKLIYTPSVSYQDNTSLDYTVGQTTNSLGEIINQTDNTYQSWNKAFIINNNLLFQHKFEKIGRSISVNIDSRIRNTDRENYYQDVYQDSTTQYLTDEIDNTIGTTLTYTEPIGNSGELSASYGLSYNNRDSNKETYLLDSETQEKVFSTELSNQFQSGYTTQVPALMYSNRSFGKFFNIGLSYQNASLNNEQVYPQEGVYQKQFNSILPTAMGRVQFKNKMNMFFRYATSTIAPSVTQLQNVIDNSNPLFFSIGNPELNQSYSHSIMMRLEKPSGDKNSSLANFSMVQMTKNYITNATEFAEKDTVLSGGIVVQEGTQISMPINLNGYWNINNTTTHSLPVSPIKSVLNSSLGFGYVRRPGKTDGVENISNTYSLNVRLSVVSNISEKVDFNTYYNVSRNQVFNSLESQSNASSNYFMQTLGVKANIIFWKGFVFRNDTYLEKYNGFSDDFNSSYILWNMSVAKKILGNDLGELELSVFDLLNQNQSFSQTITPNYIEEVRTQVLKQYFMLKFTYLLRSFKKS